MEIQDFVAYPRLFDSAFDLGATSRERAGTCSATSHLYTTLNNDLFSIVTLRYRVCTSQVTH